MKTKTLLKLMLPIILFSCNQNIFSQSPVLVHGFRSMEMEVAENIHNVMIAAVMGSPSPPKRFTLYRSTDSGITWDSVFYYGGDSNFQGSPDPVVACDSAGVFYVVVMRTESVSNPSSNTGHLWVFKSTDDGLTWTQSGKPYTGNDKADFPQIVIDKTNNRIYLAYTVYKSSPTSSSWVEFKYSTNGALTWSSAVSFTAPSAPPPAYYNAAGPNVGVSAGNKICLSYGDYNYGQIYFSTSSNLGITWQPKKIIPVDASSKFLITKMVSHPGFNHLGIVSHKPHQAKAKVYYTGSTDGGVTWQSQTIGAQASLGEGVMDDAGNVHVIFNQDTAGAFQLSYRYSVDLGITFSSIISLFNSPYSLPLCSNVPTASGEYQSIFEGNDNLLHITFVDWGDDCKTKHLTFAPLLTSFSEVPEALHAPKVFPNPVKDIANIEFKTNNLASSFEVADIQGKVLLTGDLLDGSTDLQTGSLPTGMYLLRVFCGNAIYVQKMMKE